jgi:hypothetical protein
MGIWASQLSSSRRVDNASFILGFQAEPELCLVNYDDMDILHLSDANQDQNVTWTVIG